MTNFDTREQLIASIPSSDSKAEYRVMAADGYGRCVVTRDLDDAISAIFSSRNHPVLRQSETLAIFDTTGQPVQAYSFESGICMPVPCYV